MGKSNKVKFYEPMPIWLTYKLRNCRFEQCLGPHNVIIRDLDGSFEGSGKSGSFISNNAKAANGSCSFDSA